jgi:hypothetical protein
MGHDSNVVALSDTIVRPEEITNRDSHFARFNAGADYTATLAPTTIVTFAYNGQYDSYFSVDGQDTLDNGLYATLRHALFRELAGSVTVSGQQAYQDGDSAYTGYGFRPAVQFQPYRWLGFEAYVGWSDSDYPAPNTTPDVLNRDSVTRTYGLTAFAALPEEVAFVEIGIARMDNGAKGSDFDFQASRVHVGVIVPLPWQLTADGRLTFTDYDYENLNSLAPTTPPGPVAFAFTRQDQVAEVSLRLGRPILENLLGYVQYQKTDADSNLPVYEYDQWSLTGGIVYRF